MPILFRLSTVLVVAAACARPVRQTTPARVPPAPSSESRAASAPTDSTREYSGEWESGVETSLFRGCNGTLPAKVWVSLAPGASEGARWLDNSSAARTRTYYVRVRGIVRGLAERRGSGGRPGDLGGAEYELYVTRVLEVKPSGQPHCVVKR